jgi:DNA-binding transcriptional regulator GbsR (MarR family)
MFLSDERAIRRRHFVESMGLLFSQVGGPPMLGRVLGYLVICDPPVQSLADIADYLGASRGSISQTTRQLADTGFLERVPVPGSRAAHYRLVEGAWDNLFAVRIPFTRMLREHAETGLELMADDPPALRRRAEELHAFFAFVERKFPELLAEWRRTREDR